MPMPDRCYNVGDKREIAVLFETRKDGGASVTVSVGDKMAVLPLWQFCRDMFPISEEAAERSGKI